MSKIYRQGDVVLISVDNLPENIQEKKNDGLVVLAHGEKTNHAHVVICDDMSVYQKSEELYLHIMKTAVFDHGVVDKEQKKVITKESNKDHGAIIIPVGKYFVRRQHEYTPEKIRRVQD